MFCVFDLKLSDLETLAMLRKIKIDSWRNPITTSDTPKVQSSEAIAVEEYLLKLYAAIIIVFISFKQDTSPEY